MALGALTVGGQIAASQVPTFCDRVSFLGDNSYTTGGTAGFKATLEAKLKSKREIVAVNDQSIGTHYAVYDHANDKLMVFVRATGLEAANGANLSAVTFSVAVWGR